MSGQDLMPGPIDSSVLTLQDKHRSVDVWNLTVDVAKALTCRHLSARTVGNWQVDPRVLAYVEYAGFGGIHRVAFREIDRQLVTALVERWRQETHSFHLPVGEATVTLRDVAILTRLPVHGTVVTRSAIVDPPGLVERVLGRRPTGVNDIKGSSIRIGWLRDTFGHLPEDADDVTVQTYARAYLFLLISGVLFGSKSGSHIQLIYLQLLDQDWDHIRGYSWGSACLAMLYRNLCRASHSGAVEICGPLIVLQLWAWEHIHVGRPGRPVVHRRGQQDNDDQYEPYISPPLPAADEAYGCRWVVPRLTHAHGATGLPYYRDALDRLTTQQISWDPYEPALVDAMPEHLLAHQAEWRARVPLICFEVVESHLPDRVMRQYGLRQLVPGPCDTSVFLHGIDRRGKAETNWELEHWRYIELWNGRLDMVHEGDPVDDDMDLHDPYMVWYRRVTRRFINPSFTPPSTHYQPVHDVVQGLVGDISLMIDGLSLALATGNRAQVQQVRDMAVSSLHRHGYGHVIQEQGHGDVGSCSQTQFNIGQSSGGCDDMTQTAADEYIIHSTAPHITQEAPSSTQLTPPPRPDPFTVVSHYRRRRRRRVDDQSGDNLPPIDE